MFSLPIALMAYINSSFLSSFMSEKSVGIIYALGSISAMSALLIMPKIFRKMGGYKFLLWVIGLDALSILLFAFSKNAWSAALIFIFGFTFNTLIFFSLDEILKIFSSNAITGKTRGIYLTICSLAWVMAQLASGTILGETSFRMIYFISFIITVLFLLVSYFSFSGIPDPKYDKTGAVRYIGEFFKNKNLFRAYGLSLLLQFFYCWMVIYTPIYLSLHLGFSWKEIGIIFSIMLLPFVIIPFNLGKYADKIGERKILMFGFAIASLATLTLFFIQGHQIWLWALLLFTTRIGAATIEVMNDAYFFRHIKPENEEFVGIYRSALPVAYILGPLVAFLFLIFIPSLNFIYIILGAFMLLGIYLSSTIRKSDI
jgi:MFS family permease